jgi:4-amino-4-deoxychorismate lyase
MLFDVHSLNLPKTPELLETIKLFNGGYFNLSYHEERIKWAYRELYHSKPNFNLEEILPIDPPKKGLFRVRLLYPGDPIPSVEIIPYTFPKLDTLLLLEDTGIRYNHKYLDREAFADLKGMAIEAGCSDFLLINDGYITDTSIANVVFENKYGFFVSDKFLLPGTKREFLIAKKAVQEIPIRPEDLYKYKKLYLINALIDIEDDISIPIDKILY